MGPHTTVCVLILLYMLGMQVIQRIPATVYVCLHTTMYVSSYYGICVLILLYMCPQTAIYAGDAGNAAYSCCYICALILRCMCPHTTVYVSSYYYMCPHTTIYVSSY
jgi:hypothetical protein